MQLVLRDHSADKASIVDITDPTHIVAMGQIKGERRGLNMGAHSRQKGQKKGGSFVFFSRRQKSYGGSKLRVTKSLVST